MNVKKLYTAVGRLTRQKNAQGIECPTVLLSGKEYQLDLQELMVWTCLNWRLVRMEEIGPLYEKLSEGSSHTAARSLDACVNRLLVRGLLICGSGETEYDALYDLLSAMYIIPISTNPVLQLCTALKLALMDQIRLSSVKSIFRRDRRSDNEKQVMTLARQALLSTAEIIRCVEMGVERLRNDSVVEAIYNDRDTTSDNIAALVKTAPCTQDVTVAIANLYLRQQIIFDRV